MGLFFLPGWEAFPGAGTQFSYLLLSPVLEVQEALNRLNK